MKNKQPAFVLGLSVLLPLVIALPIFGQRAGVRIRPKASKPVITPHPQPKPGTGSVLKATSATGSNLGGTLKPEPPKGKEKKWPKGDEGGGTAPPPVKKATPTPTPTPAARRVTAKPNFE